jgi:predicted  nucleic acid-binding Zn-ribbon protein
MALTRHCWKCGVVYELNGSPGRSEACPKCRSDLKVCLNCVSYEPRLAYQCRDRRAEPVEQKDAANYCDYFEMARREYRAPGTAFEISREAKAREDLKRLFGD